MESAMAPMPVRGGTSAVSFAFVNVPTEATGRAIASPDRERILHVVRHLRRHLAMLVATGAVAGIFTAPPATGQVLDVHAIGSVETMRQSTSWGGGLGIGTVLRPADLIVVGLTTGADYIREQHLGKGLATVSLDATLSPPNVGAHFVPFVGGSVGLNWSGGALAQWTGARVGLDALVGFRALIGGGERLGWKIEERYGYVAGFEHAYSTRLGFLIGL
jgi:hypothetical protein